jgi:hypothetical protein
MRLAMVATTRFKDNSSTGFVEHLLDPNLSLNNSIVAVLDGTINSNYSIVSYTIVDLDKVEDEEGQIVKKRFPRC